MHTGISGFIHQLAAPLMGFVFQYGLVGLFFSAFIGSTIFVPFSVEAAEIFLIEAKQNPYLVVVVAAVGALMGTWVNYGIGFFGSEIVEKRIGINNINKAKAFMNKYGWSGLFLVIFIPTPIPVDPITIIPGITRMGFLEFSIVIFVAKLLRYALVAAILAGFVGFMHL